MTFSKNRHKRRTKEQEQRDRALREGDPAVLGAILQEVVDQTKEKLSWSINAHNRAANKLYHKREELALTPHAQLIDAAKEVLRVYSYVNEDHVKCCNCGLCRLARCVASDVQP